MSKKILVFIITTLLSILISMPVIAADKSTGEAKTDQAAETVVESADQSSKLINLSNPEEVLNPDKYITLINIAKKWLFAHGPSILIALGILVVGRWLAMWLASIARKALTRGNVEVTLARFLAKLIYYALLAAVVIAAADQVGIETTSFLAIFAAAGLAIGLALKDSLSNFASGVMIILFGTFRVGDYVNAGGVSGSVQQIDIFSTILLTPDNQRIIVPNGLITSDVITNVNAEATRRIDLVVGIGYDDDIRKAKSTLESLVAADTRILKDPAPVVAVSELADSSVNLIVRPWVETQDYWGVKLDLIEEIKLTFDEEGISFPYPQQDVHMHQAS